MYLSKLCVMITPGPPLAPAVGDAVQVPAPLTIEQVDVAVLNEATTGEVPEIAIPVRADPSPYNLIAQTDPAGAPFGHAAPKLCPGAAIRRNAVPSYQIE